MKRVFTWIIAVCILSPALAQETNKAKVLLDEVSEKMGAYTNMQIGIVL